MYVGGASHVGPAVQLRENFARACFEALLQFSFMQNNDSTLGELGPKSRRGWLRRRG